MEFTEKILEVMEDRNITAYEICKNLHISNTTFSSWKKGSKPSVNTAIEILRYLQLSADEMFELNTFKPQLTENEVELLAAFRRLPEREQIKEIGKMEDKAEHYNSEPGKSYESKIG